MPELSELTPASQASFSFENFSLNAANLLNKISNAYDRLQESDGSTSLCWTEDYPPKYWVAHRLQGLIEEAREFLADAGEELDRIDSERRARLNGAAPMLIPR